MCDIFVTICDEIVTPNVYVLEYRLVHDRKIGDAEGINHRHNRHKIKSVTCHIFVTKNKNHMKRDKESKKWEKYQETLLQGL